MNVTMLGNDYTYAYAPQMMGGTTYQIEGQGTVNSGVPKTAEVSATEKRSFDSIVDSLANGINQGVDIYKKLKNDPNKQSASDQRLIDLAMASLQNSGGNPAVAKQSVGISAGSMMAIGGVALAGIIVVALIMKK